MDVCTNAIYRVQYKHKLLNTNAFVAIYAIYKHRAVGVVVIIIVVGL